MRLGDIIKGYFGGDDRDERVRRKLVETLYTQPTSLAAGAVAGIACTATAIAVSDSLAITVAGIAPDRHRGAARGAWPSGSRAIRVGRDARTLEVLYEVGAFTYAFLSGLVAALTVYNPHGGHIQTLMVTYALGLRRRHLGAQRRAAGDRHRPAAAVGRCRSCSSA